MAVTEESCTELVLVGTTVNNDNMTISSQEEERNSRVDSASSSGFPCSVTSLEAAVAKRKQLVCSNPHLCDSRGGMVLQLDGRLVKVT